MSDLTTKAAEIRAGLGSAEQIATELRSAAAFEGLGTVYSILDRAAALIEQQAAELEEARTSEASLTKRRDYYRERMEAAESERDELLREKERLGVIADNARLAIVLSLSFLSRDLGTDRLRGTVSDVIRKLSDADTGIRRARSALENGPAGLADAHSKSPAPSSQSERIAVLEAERDAAWGRGMRDAAQIAEQRFEDDPGYCVYADGSEIASEIREAIRARSALAPLGEE